MAILDGDFSLGTSSTAVVGSQPAADTGRGIKRSWLKIYETLPNQLLNGYGQSKFVNIPDKEMWQSMGEPIRSGAPCMSELCFSDKERRGVGINRWLQPLESYMKYQQEERNKKHNQMILSERIFTEVYAEIDKILPSVTFCLAPRKYAEKKGANLLRSSAMGNPGVVSSRSRADLQKHAKILYEWLDPVKISRLRMLMNWQAAGGLSFVTSCHQRGVQCFRVCGGSPSGDTAPSLEDFQEAIISRHTLGSTGIDEDNRPGGSDFNQP